MTADGADTTPADGSDEDVAPGEDAEASELLHGCPVSSTSGQRVVHATLDGYLDLVRALHDDGYLMCLDVTAVDYLTHPGRAGLPATVEPERFEVVTTLINHTERQRVRVRVQVPEANAVVPSLFELHPGSEAMEREVYDMFGVVFTGHPDLTRILMPEDWEGHPLRKDAAKGRIPVQFKGVPAGRG